MIDDRTAPLGAFVLRAALGVMYLARSLILKYLDFSLPGTAEYVRSIGVPGWMAYATLAAKLVAGALLLLGMWSRLIAVGLIPVLAGAFSVHAGHGWALSNPNGWEYPVVLIVMSAMLALLGDGATALKPTPALLRRPR